MEPTGNGIGGDLFAIVWDPKTKKLHGYNGSGRSPKVADAGGLQRRA
jgi:gamma-glutamyltranspeptidase/glutathione hydrolase